MRVVDATSRAKRAALLKRVRSAGWTLVHLLRPGHQPRETRGPIETSVLGRAAVHFLEWPPAARNARPY